MPAPPPIDRYQPSFLRFPIMNDRTGFKPVALPVILIVPGRRNENGTTIAGTDVFDVKYFITKAPEPAKVAGPFNKNKLIPQLNQYELNISKLQLHDVLIDISNQTIVDSNGNAKDQANATEGDYIQYTLIRGNTRSTIPYFPDADYYDLSNFEIDVEDLPKPHRYHFVWQASYNRRLIYDPALGAESAFCISEAVAIAQYNMIINHPGEVHHSMFRKTPPFYFDESQNNFLLSNDQVLEFYRPFADMLQDIFDEQTFINGINHIDQIPAQLIPYLAYLIGWDLPNYPGASDTIRRSILRHAVRLQQLKGSKRAIVELFDIFGYTIDIINLWYSTDLTRLIAPEETLPSVIAGEQITTETVCQIEPMVADYATDGFGEFEVPLIYRPNGDFTVTAYLVQNGQTRNVLNNIVNEITDNPDTLEDQCQRTNGNLVPKGITDQLPASDATLIAYSDVYVDFSTGKGESTSSSTAILIINDIGVKYNKEQNLLTVNFDHHQDFTNDETKIFIFVTYPRDKIIVPETLENLRSNRFDVRILLRDGDVPPSTMFEFLLNFVFKLKAFHSLLRKIIYRVNFYEVYNVQDACYGPEYQLQVPPAVEPMAITEDICNEAAIAYGYKTEDIQIRTSIFDALLDNFLSWKSLDNSNRIDEELNKFLNLTVNGPAGQACQYTRLGQDRISSSPDVDLDHNPDQRSQVCDESPTVNDSCFKGRVKDNLFVIPTMLQKEIVRCKPCPLGMGSGYYWLYPQTEQSLLRDGFGSYTGQVNTSFLGKKIQKYNHPVTSLHYTNRPYLFDGQLETDRLLSYQRPSLEVQKDNLAFPSHRFPLMAFIEDDFTHPVWSAKPWDDADNDLDVSLVVGSDGDEYLEFDEADIIYLGNGITPDISSLGSHLARNFLVTHKVYQTAEAGHASLSLDDQTILTEEEFIEFDSSVPYNPIFESYNPDCNKDYINGYPAEYGFTTVDPDEFGFERDETTELLGESLGLTDLDGTSIEALFLCGSQILVENSDVNYSLWRPYRVDCACSRYGCGSNTGLTDPLSGLASSSELTAVPEGVLNVDQCHISLFQQPNGSLDFNCDQLSLGVTGKLSESLGICSTMFDGSIENLICIISDGEIPDSILPEGSVYWKDEYDVIHEINWVYQDNFIDILAVTKSPHVWGEEDSGYMSGYQVFRRGIITSVRQIIRINDDGTYEIRGEGSTQKIDYFRTNVLCGEQPFVDNFCYHLDCIMSDKVDTQVVCGPRWVPCEDDEVQWPMLVLDSSGTVVGTEVSENVQPFAWVNVWGNQEEDDLTGVCITDYGTEPVVDLTFEGEGGEIPALNENNGNWPTLMPHYSFMSEIDISVDRRIVEFLSIKFVDFEHTFSGDLHAVLYSPLGVPAVTIFHRPGSTNGSYGNFGDFNGDYTFFDSSLSLLTDFGNIAPGAYRRDPGDWPGGVSPDGLVPVGSFDDFKNVRTRGKWKLVIYDWAGGDVGSLGSWVMRIRTTCN